MKRQAETFVECPKCGYQYTLGEIFIPSSVIGKCTNITRDTSGKIIDFDGENTIKYESYQCDRCNSFFTVNIKIDLNEKEAPFGNFGEGQRITLNKAKLFLEE